MSADGSFFALGQRVEKFTGEARWHGVIVARYTTTRGALRYVVEVEPQGFQMIAVPSQLRAQPAAMIETTQLGDAERSFMPADEEWRHRTRPSAFDFGDAPCRHPELGEPGPTVRDLRRVWNIPTDEPVEPFGYELSLKALRAGNEALRSIAEVIARPLDGEQCQHLGALRQYTGDGTPVDFCPHCGRNKLAGQRWPEGEA
jgi:hypothetical protein